MDDNSLQDNSQPAQDSAPVSDPGVVSGGDAPVAPVEEPTAAPEMPAEGGSSDPSVGVDGGDDTTNNTPAPEA